MEIIAPRKIKEKRKTNLADIVEVLEKRRLVLLGIIKQMIDIKIYAKLVYELEFIVNEIENK